MSEDARPVAKPFCPLLPSSVDTWISAPAAAHRFSNTSSAEDFAPSTRRTATPFFVAASTRGAVGAMPAPPATTRIRFPVIEKPLPKGPLIPTMSPSAAFESALVPSPTIWYVMPNLSPMYEMDIGNSSTPGTHTMTNCPGRASTVSLNRMVFVQGVSLRCSATLSILRLGVMSSTYHVIDLRVAVFVHEPRDVVAYRFEHSGSPRPDSSADLDGGGSGHDVLERVPACGYPAHADHGYLDRIVDLVDTPHADRSYRRAREPSEPVCQDRHPSLWGYRHPLERVDCDHSVRAAHLSRLGEVRYG